MLGPEGTSGSAPFWVAIIVGVRASWRLTYADLVAELELTPTSLIVHIRGVDQFFALKTQLEAPLEHVASVEVSPPEARRVWDVHDPDKAIAIHLHDERYAKLVIGVDDPDATAEAIKAAIQKPS